jgi:hypothetical protein
MEDGHQARMDRFRGLRRGHSLRIQRFGDAGQPDPIATHRENAPNDFGLFRDDDLFHGIDSGPPVLARLVGVLNGNVLVAEESAAGIETLSHAALLATMNLLGKPIRACSSNMPLTFDGYSCPLHRFRCIDAVGDERDSFREGGLF